MTSLSFLKPQETKEESQSQYSVVVILPLNPTHRALQYLSDPLPLLHHVEVLSQVRRHVPLPEVLGVVLIDAVKVPLLVGHCGCRGRSDHHLTGIGTHASALRMGVLTCKTKQKQNI